MFNTHVELLENVAKGERLTNQKEDGRMDSGSLKREQQAPESGGQGDMAETKTCKDTKGMV